MTSASQMEERIKKLDALCLNEDEQDQICKLNEAEVAALRARKQKAKSFAWSSFTAIGFASPVGAVNTVRNACQFNKSEDELNKIRNERDKLRQQAQERYEKAMGLDVNQVLSQMQKEEGMCYE